jgi:peptidylprolyl isomerase
VQGDGPKVEKGQTIVVNYLGQVYGGKAPFDTSYSGEPASFQIGAGKVVKGWDQGLVGRPVGSRVMLSIPPSLGYGKDGNKEAGIKGTDTLYFVVDILAAG